MVRFTKLALLMALIAVLGISCSQGPDNVTSSATTTPTANNVEKLAIPNGATLVSATLNVRAEYMFAPVYVHRITSDWDELSVTWNSFAGAFDPTVEATFNSGGAGWHSVDVTSLVQAWMDGTYENYGFLMEQPVDISLYYSSEYGDIDYRPYLELCYTDGGSNVCDTIIRGGMGTVADAYIWEGSPNEPYGGREYFYTGWLANTEKQTLIKFDMDYVPCTVCLGDTVWYDDNKDGIQNNGEPGAPDVSVELYDCSGKLVGTTTTDANGYYSFCDLPEGGYQVKFIAPEGYLFTTPDVGDDAMDSDAGADGLTGCYQLGCEDNNTIDAGLVMRELGGCSLTIGFWKTHAGFGPQADVVTQYLPISLGSFVVGDAATAVQVLSMDQCEGPKNGITKLMAQMLGTKLNALSGADVSDVQDELDAADAFLTTHTCADWAGMSKKDQKAVLNLMSTFDDYNNGIIGPGHCD